MFILLSCTAEFLIYKLIEIEEIWQSRQSLRNTYIIYGAGLQSGGLAQLARALAWHARGQRFESVILHVSLRYRTNDL